MMLERTLYSTMSLALQIVRKNQRFLIYVLLGFCVVLGLCIAGDYGLGWDEPTSDYIGRISLSYVENIQAPDAPLWTSFMRYYGVVVELPLAFVEETLHLTSHQVFVFRHTATFLLFLAGVFVFYLFCLRRFKAPFFALLGPIFLLASPRIFADAFYNSKDIPTLVFFIISIFTLFRFLEKPTAKNILWHTLACALLIDIRLPGILVSLLTLGFFCLSMLLVPAYKTQWRRMLGFLVIFLALLPGLVILFWPFLWQHPIAHFLGALSDMDHFSRQANLQILYAGREITASTIPWHYIPLWMFITTPVVYIVLFFLGVGASIGKFFSNILEFFRAQKQDLLVLCWFFGPLIAVIALHSIMYDGWRHLYFIYPAFIYLGLVGIEALLVVLRPFDVKVQTAWAWAIAAVITASVLGTVWFMVRNHPYQNLYFNVLAGGEENARKNFEMDYWGLTFRSGLEYIAANDSASLIPIYIAGGSPDTVLILTPEMQKRFSVVNDAGVGVAKYVLSNYRWQDYDSMPWEKEFYSVKVDGVNVMTVFKTY